MPAISDASYRGRVSVRPWRVGVLVDMEDEAQLVRAISWLSSVWGGMYMPILDVRIDANSLVDAVEMFDLDSLYAHDPSSELKEVLRQSQCEWKGIGEYGPFTARDNVHMGLLPWKSLASDHGAARVEWTGGSEPAIAVSAYLGEYGQAGEHSISRPLLESARLLQLKSGNQGAPRGFAVLRREMAKDAAWFWNCRAISGAVLPLVSSVGRFNAGLLSEVVDLSVFGVTASGRGNETPIGVPVWGFDDLEQEERKRLESWAADHDVKLEGCSREESLSRFFFPGFHRISSSNFRTTVSSTSRFIPVDIPQLPMRSDSHHHPGIVAVEVKFHDVAGADPRLTVDVPPLPRFRKWIERPGYGANQARASSDGLVFGVQADLEEISIQNMYRLDVMRLLFGDQSVETSQSDEGMFQTRAAELFGGPFAGHLNQPGVRAAIQKAGAKNSGMTVAHLQRLVSDARGEWPDEFAAFGRNPKQYAERQVLLLLNSGLLVPYLQVRCHSCRIILQLSPEQLGDQFKCEFCGVDVRLALALALTKPEWKYRLAGHLSAPRVEGFLPAMAATGVLGSLHHIQGTPACHIFGLEVTLPGRNKIEVDVATIMQDDDWVVVLGEVKNRNRIDADDATNLFGLCSALFDQGVVAVPMFATLKDEFSDEEQTAIREAMQASARSVRTRGQVQPLTALILTNREMSLPSFHDEQPWRWEQPGFGTGVLGTALESCKRHLGLKSVTWTAGNVPRPHFEWGPD